MSLLALALSALAVLVAPASALAVGSISGLVTDGADPLGSVEVCAWEVPEEEEFGCTETDSFGEYTIAGLAAGNYKVEFWPLGSANFVPQYFNAKSSWALADQVPVTNGNNTPNVNAILEEGGWIEGRAIDAVSKAGIGGLWVCAGPIDETGFGRCAVTEASGDYEIAGLATDAYEVVFFSEEAGSEYLPQFYKGKANFFEATPVNVTAGSGTGGIDAEMSKAAQIASTVTHAAAPPPPAPALIAPIVKPKLHCPKGKHKVHKKGKTRCVKTHHRKKHHHAHHPSGYGRLYRPAAHQSLLP